MNAPFPAPSTRPLTLQPKWIAAGVLLLVVYLLMRPWLVERFGWDLPGFTDSRPNSGASAPDGPSNKRQKADKNRPVEVPVIPGQGESVVEEQAADKQVATTETNPTDRTQPASERTTKPVAPSKPKNNTSSAKPDAEVLKPGWKGLKSIGRGKLESPAGLIYDQYRIDHVMEHTRDNTDKPSHGVFDVSTQDEVLALIDEAFGLTRKRGPPQVITEDEGDRTAFTVNLNRKIGRAGGQSGARRRNPPLQKVKIVVEDTRVITAFPTN